MVCRPTGLVGHSAAQGRRAWDSAGVTVRGSSSPPLERPNNRRPSREERPLVHVRYQLWHATPCGNPHACVAVTTITPIVSLLSPKGGTQTEVLSDSNIEGAEARSLRRAPLRSWPSRAHIRALRGRDESEPQHSVKQRHGAGRG